MSLTAILGLLLALSLLGNAGLAKLYVIAKEDKARIEQAYNSFKAQVKVAGDTAEKEAKERTAAERKAKENADAENRKTAAANAASIASLRRDRDSARGAFLRAAPSGSKCPDGQTCFDSALYLGAYGGLVKGVRGLADEGTAVTTDLDTARKWARP